MKPPARMFPQMTEKEWQGQFVDLAHTLGYKPSVVTYSHARERYRGASRVHSALPNERFRCRDSALPAHSDAVTGTLPPTYRNYGGWMLALHRQYRRSRLRTHQLRRQRGQIVAHSPSCLRRVDRPNSARTGTRPSLPKPVVLLSGALGASYSSRERSTRGGFAFSSIRAVRPWA